MSLGLSSGDLSVNFALLTGLLNAGGGLHSLNSHLLLSPPIFKRRLLSELLFLQMPVKCHLLLRLLACEFSLLGLPLLIRNKLSLLLP